MTPGKLKRKFYRYLPIIKISLKIIIILLLAYWLIFRLLPPTFRFFQSLIKEPIFFLSLLKSRQPNLRHTYGRVNLLLLGAGGVNQTAGDLTDSIILASINLENGEAVLISIPRDLWIDSMKAKVNTAYHWGEEKKKGGGLILAKAVVVEILAQPVHYAVLLDFGGFIKAIDLVGGVEIEVERAFDDYKYPIPGMEEAEPEEARYEHLHFDQGWQNMNGERALKYARSRYAEGEEGTDFARSKRQQKLLLAFKDKVFSLKTLLSARKIKELINVFGDSVESDIKEEEWPEFLKLALKMKKAEIKTYVLDEELFYHPQEKVQGQWVLLPKSGDWQEVQEYVKSLISNL